MTRQEWEQCEDVMAMLQWVLQHPTERLGEYLGHCMTMRVECATLSIPFVKPELMWPVKPTDRKLRLLACACVRSARAYQPIDAIEAIDSAEAHADDPSLPLLTAPQTAQGPSLPWCCCLMEPSAAALSVVSSLSQLSPVNIIREQLGYPAEPAKMDPAWLTPAVVGLAEDAWVNRVLGCPRCDFTGKRGDGACGVCGGRCDGLLNNDTLAILADAVEDAGCQDPHLLAHLRSPEAHYRGCWALDRVRASNPSPRKLPENG